MKRISTHTLVTMAVLGALSTLLFLLFEIPIFGNVYKLDFSNVPVLLAGFSMGPMPALGVALLKDLFHLILKGIGSTVGIGELADFLMTAAFVLPASLVYRRVKTQEGALRGMIWGCVAMCVVAVPLNAFLMFPFYMSAFNMDLVAIGAAIGPLFGQDTGMVGLLLGATLPFNLLKGVVLCLLTYGIYKPLSPLLHGKKK